MGRRRVRVPREPQSRGWAASFASSSRRVLSVHLLLGLGARYQSRASPPLPLASALLPPPHVIASSPTHTSEYSHYPDDDDDDDDSRRRGGDRPPDASGRVLFYLQRRSALSTTWPHTAGTARHLHDGAGGKRIAEARPGGRENASAIGSDRLRVRGGGQRGARCVSHLGIKVPSKSTCMTSECAYDVHVCL